MRVTTLTMPGAKPRRGAVVMALVFAAEVGLVLLLSPGRYATLQDLDGGWGALVSVYNATKLSVPLLLILGAAVRLSAANRALLAHHTPGAGMIALHVLCVAGLVGLLLLLPQGRVAGPPEGLGWVYLGAIALMNLAALSAALIVSPLHRLAPAERRAMGRGYAVLPGAIALVLGGLLVADAYIIDGRAGLLWSGSLIPPAVTDAIEATTLRLSLFLYTLPGLALPDISFAENGDAILKKAGFAIQMAPECSGYQGMLTSIVAMLAFIALDWRRLHLPRAALLALATVGVVFLMNAVRVAALFYIGVHLSPEIAVNGFHSHFGTISLLVIVGVALVILQHPVFDRRAAGGRSVAQARPAPLSGHADLVPLILPLAIMLAVSFVAGSVQGEFNWLYFVGAFTGAGLMWAVRDRIRAEMRGAPTLAALVCGVAVYVLWIAMIPTDPERIALFEETLGAAALPVVIAWVVIRVLGSSIVVPVLEELAFRAGLMRLIERIAAPQIGAPMAVVASVGLTSVAFGLMHADVLAATLAGLAYGVLAAWRGRAGDAIVAHAVTNFLIAVHVLALGHWSYW